MSNQPRQAVPSDSSSASPPPPPSAFGVGGGSEFVDKAVVPVLAGTVAGSIEICITYPLEFAKSSMQVQPGRFRSMFHAVQFNVAKDGPLVLYRGLPSWCVRPRSGRENDRARARTRARARERESQSESASARETERD
jgi:hypothetical protein